MEINEHAVSEAEVAAKTAKGPTFEDLTLDESLSDIERIARYSTSAIALQRLVHVKLISETAKTEGFAAAKRYIFPILDDVANDPEYHVRQHTAEQLRGLAEVCVKDGGPEGYAAVTDTILPLLSALLTDSKAEVRIAAGETLVAVAEWVAREDHGPRLLTIVLALAHDDEQEDQRMTAAVLLNELADTLGPDLCAQFVLPEVINLAEDPVFRVRKAAALNLDAIFRTAGPAVASKRLLPTYLRLAADDIWGVRKSCAESLVSVSKCLDPSVRVAELIPVFERFANDASKWVRNAAYQHLGPFLATLPGPKITPQLLSHYVRMGLSATAAAAAAAAAANPGGAATAGGMSAEAAAALARTGSEAVDAELAVYCAFSFPAVVLTLGRSRWPELRGLFTALSRDVQRKVRRPLSHALHEIAKLLGTELAEADLCPAFDLYLHDVEEVKVGVLRSLAAFLSVLSPARREAYLPIFDELYRATLPNNWRMRKVLATQLPLLSPLFSPAATYSVLVPFALNLLHDVTAVVREDGALGVPLLINKLAAGEPPELLPGFLARLQQLASAGCYRDRLAFVHLARACSGKIDAGLFQAHFLPQLLGLAQDAVRNVRLAVAELLAPLAATLVTVTAAAAAPAPAPAAPSAGVGAATGAEQEGASGNSGIANDTSNSNSGGSSSSSTGGGADRATSASAALSATGVAASGSGGSSSGDVFSGIDEEVYPLWARGDGAATVTAALSALAEDCDVEVLRRLTPAWLQHYRHAPVPDVRDYILQRAKPSPAALAAAAAAVAVAATSGDAGGNGGDATSASVEGVLSAAAAAAAAPALVADVSGPVSLPAPQPPTPASTPVPSAAVLQLGAHPSGPSSAAASTAAALAARRPSAESLHGMAAAAAAFLDNWQNNRAGLGAEAEAEADAEADGGSGSGSGGGSSGDDDAAAREEQQEEAALAAVAIAGRGATVGEAFSRAATMFAESAAADAWGDAASSDHAS